MNETRLTVGQLLSGGLEQILAKKKQTVLSVVALAGLQVGITLFSVSAIMISSAVSDAVGEIGLVVAIGIVMFVIMAVLAVIVTMAIMPDNAIPKGGVLSNLHLVGIAMVAYVVSTIGIGIGFVFLILPGLYLLARWYLIVPLIVSGKSGGVDAFGASWDATPASAGALMGVTVLVFIPSLLLGLSDLYSGDPDAFPTTYRVILDAIIYAVGTMFSIAISVFAYRKLIDDREEISAVFD